MRLGPALLLLLPLAGAAPLGCAAQRERQVETPAPPSRVSNLDEFGDGLNHFVLLEDDDPQRQRYRAVLIDFLVHHIDESLAQGEDDEARTALEYAGALYRPAELRATAPSTKLATAAHRVFSTAARRGAEEPAMLALAVEQQFGSQRVRKDALRRWKEIESWIVRHAMFSTEPVLRHEELERALEEVAAVFPSPFVTQRLADLYFARYKAARSARSRGAQIASAAVHRTEVTGYLLIRVYLRADDINGALAALKRLELDPPTRKLGEFVQQARDAKRSAGAILTLAAQFMPDEGGEVEIPMVFVTQGWGIVDNLSRRAVREHPKDAFAHLIRARTLYNRGLLDAAIVHLRRSIEHKEDVFEAWQQLAILHQGSLERLANRDPDAARARLADLEEFHGRAVELWRDRPIRPGLPEAYFSVAEGLYEIGRVDEAQSLLDRSARIEPVANALDLLGTIALKRDRLGQAKTQYERLANLPQQHPFSRLRWRARAREQLGEVSHRENQVSAAEKHRRVALRHVNELVSVPGLDDETRAATLVARGRLLFHLGDVSLAMADFRNAGAVAPGSPQAYADPLLFVVSRGYYDEAIEIYRRALIRKDLADSLKLYFTLWITELALRQDRPPDPIASGFLAEFAGAGWERKLALHARGKLSFEKLLQNAGDSGERAEAYFYEGLRRWRKGDSGAGKALMRKVLNTQMMGFFEYEMAQAYLKWNDLPTQARTPKKGAAKRRRR